jgi:hypothetical protein
VILTGLAVLWPLASWAADNITPFDGKPGLWEAVTEIGGMPAMPAMPAIPEETLARMPAAQRAQVEAMMKGRGAGGGPTTTSKICLTKDSFDKSSAFGQSDKSCTYKVVSSSSSKQQVHVECTKENTKTTGDMTIERVDAEHVRGTMTMNSPSIPQPLNMKVSFTWLSSDCGDVKPAGAK